MIKGNPAMKSNKTPFAACLVVKVQLSGGGVAASVIMPGRRRCIRMMLTTVGCVSLTPQIRVLVHATGENPQIYGKETDFKGIVQPLQRGVMGGLNR
jgi:hypothetical protein